MGWTSRHHDRNTWGEASDFDQNSRIILFSIFLTDSEESSSSQIMSLYLSVFGDVIRSSLKRSPVIPYRSRISELPRCPSWVSHVSPLPGPPIVSAAPGELPKRGVFGHMHRKESETGLLRNENYTTWEFTVSQYHNKKIGSRLRVRILSSNHHLFDKGSFHSLGLSFGPEHTSKALPTPRRCRGDVCPSVAPEDPQIAPLSKQIFQRIVVCMDMIYLDTQNC